MKWKLLTLFLLITFSNLVLAKKNKLGIAPVTDFRGIELGSKPKSDMYLLSNGKGRFNYYKKKNEYKKVGDIELKDITYGYYDNKLYEIKLDLGYEAYCTNLESLKIDLEKKYKVKIEYGNKTKFFNPMSNYHFWRSEFSNLTIQLSCSRYDSSSMYLSSVEIFNPDVPQKTLSQFLEENKDGVKDL